MRELILSRAKKKEFENHPLLEQIIRLLGFENNLFFYTTTSRGVITADVLNSYNTLYTGRYRKIKNKSEFLIHIMDCYLSSFYTTIWVPRCLPISVNDQVPPQNPTQPPPPPQPPPPFHQLHFRVALFGEGE